MTVSATTTLRAIAYENGLLDSPVASAIYSIGPPPSPAAAPAFSSAPGNTVAITSASAGVTIRYTTDGTIPTETNGTVYSGPVTITVNPTTLQAIAYGNGFSDSAPFGVTIRIPTLTITSVPGN